MNVGQMLPNGRTKHNIYVASSWRNELQPSVVEALRAAGHEVYDFRAPAPGVSGFSWSEIDPAWQDWTPAAYRDALQHPVAKRGYGYDIAALRACTIVVLVLPSGRSASWEFGYAMGQGKHGIVLQIGKLEPELMYRAAQIATSIEELHVCVGPRLVSATRPADTVTGVVVTINGMRTTTSLTSLSYEDIVRLAGARGTPTVTWRYRGGGDESSGEMHPGSGTICAADGLLIEAVQTGGA